MSRLPCLLLLAFCLAGPAAAGPWRADAGNVTGWQLMTPAERVEHQRRLRSFTRYADCRAYLDAHHAEMAARARAAGVVLQPRAQSACEQLRARGRLE